MYLGQISVRYLGETIVLRIWETLNVAYLLYLGQI